jgi:hypothetical protein
MSGARSGNDTEGRGGGGAGSAGGDTACAEPGDAGNGRQSSITGTTYYYAGGGGGGAYYGGSLGTTRSGNGGLGGGGGGGAFTDGTVGTGGTGGTAVGETPTLNMGTLGQGVGGAGGTNTGGGGGGCGNLDKGGTGGSGIVIVRYLTPTAATNATSKVTVTLKYGTPQQTISNSTYIGFTPIVTNGLVLNLDAANSASYPGTDTNWTDLSGNGNNGTLVNSPAYSATNGGYLSFIGASSQYASIADSTSLLTANAITIEYWVKINSLADSALASKHRQSTSPISGWNNYLLSSGKISFQLRAGNVCCQTLDTTATVGTTQWNHIASTYDGTTMKVYINGVQDATTTPATGSVDSTQSINIGRDVNSGSAYLNGLIATTRIYKRALTATEVTQNFNALKGRYGL